MNPFLAPNLEHIKTRAPGCAERVLKRRLKNIYWPVWKKPCVCEVTVNSACNSNCLFCYIPPSSAGKTPEPGFKAAAEALYEGRRRGAWLAVVIGGEPTLRADIGGLARLARKIGYPCVKLCTNGLKLADKGYARELAGSGFNMIDISLHGCRSGIHDRLVGVPGAFARVMKAMENVKALGVELGTNQVINRLNYRTFPEFFDLALNGIGINYFNIIYSNYRGAMALNSSGLKINISAAVPYIERGLKAYESSSLPVFSRILVNFPPCVLPGYGHLTADWELSSEQGDETLLLPDGKTVRMQKMKDGQKKRPAGCAKCVLSKRCRGVDREYLEIFGGKEFVPLKREPALSPLISLL